jgi:hypothetical protein
VNAFTQLSQQFYWNPGWYKLSIRIATAHPERTFTEGWRFELTQAQSNSLRLNAIKVVQEVCGQYIGEYNFAYVAYRPPVTVNPAPFSGGARHLSHPHAIQSSAGPALWTPTP